MFPRIYLLVIPLLSLNYSVFADDNTAISPVTVNPSRLSIEQSSEVIDSIMLREEFNTSETVFDWNFNFDLDDDEIDGNNELAELLLTILARSVEYVLWILPVILIIYLIYYRKYWIRYLTRSGIQNFEHKAEYLFGLKLDKKSLPDDISTFSLKLWSSGKEREALSLLFRASLINLFAGKNIIFSDGLTEHECINIVNNSVDRELASYFELIATMWIKMAYGHKKPDSQEFIKISNLWNEYFLDGKSS